MILYPVRPAPRAEPACSGRGRLSESHTDARPPVFYSAAH